VAGELIAGLRRSASHFDANGNLLTFDNIGTLNWHYNNTLNQLTKTDKISQQPENCENRNDPDLVQAFLKKWWVHKCYMYLYKNNVL
jgi:hypothetical protein